MAWATASGFPLASPGAKTIANEVDVILTTGPAVDGRPAPHYLDVVAAQAIMERPHRQGQQGAQEHRRRAIGVVRGRDRQDGRRGDGRVGVGAERLGAGAILSIDIDHETVGNTMLMVAASRTAVKLGRYSEDAVRVGRPSTLRERQRQWGREDPARSTAGSTGVSPAPAPPCSSLQPRLLVVAGWYS